MKWFISKKLCTFAAKADFPVHILRVPHHHHLTDKLLNCEQFLTEPDNRGSNRLGDPGKAQRHLVLVILPAARLLTVHLISVATRGNLGSPAKPTRKFWTVVESQGVLGRSTATSGGNIWMSQIKKHWGKAHSSALNCSFHLYKTPCTITTCCGFRKTSAPTCFLAETLALTGAKKTLPKMFKYF